MNHQRPASAAATNAGGLSTAHPPIWYYGPEIPIIGSNGMGVFGFSLALLLLLPGYGLATFLFTGPDVIQGVQPNQGESLTASSFILIMLASAVFIGAFFAWVVSEPQVQAFTFDENQQLLTLTLTRRCRSPVEVHVPFSEIISIRPYVMTSSAHDGHFRVVYRGAKGKVFEHRLGDGTSLENIEFHGAWLRGMLGGRMCELIDLDI
ncbi:hypothetical protein LRQ11_23605 [Pseudomonas sp. MAFF 311095]|uniref:Uncharacterized protein n=1 Tax=Pseudomonas petroselini TaxID=2899822 RepID=A0ABS8QWQ1_9PSED|nr:hypothetical protein [Pseudomonas petroselini]MCD7040051.1 hypothetical protein [Pseudomonas petroselini]MCD7046228.1 hypothetical protein [Pseudomonas petroselini]MCD7067672.1 hypothetical protein [Pseudomonas petroselini]MCD7081629.1 hypothetical protein [Pseudomonas petroselini]